MPDVITDRGPISEFVISSLLGGSFPKLPRPGGPITTTHFISSDGPKLPTRM